MDAVERDTLEQVLAGSTEPVLIVNVDQADWPVAFANPAFAPIGGDQVTGQHVVTLKQQVVSIHKNVRSITQSGSRTNFCEKASGARNQRRHLRLL